MAVPGWCKEVGTGREAGGAVGRSLAGVRRCGPTRDGGVRVALAGWSVDVVVQCSANIYIHKLVHIYATFT